MTFWASLLFVARTVWGTVGCSTAPLASAYQIPITTPPASCEKQKCPQTLSSVPWGTKSPQLGMSDLAPSPHFSEKGHEAHGVLRVRSLPGELTSPAISGPEESEPQDGPGSSTGAGRSGA